MLEDYASEIEPGNRDAFFEILINMGKTLHAEELQEGIFYGLYTFVCGAQNL